MGRPNYSSLHTYSTEVKLFSIENRTWYKVLAVLGRELKVVTSSAEEVMGTRTGR